MPFEIFTDSSCDMTLDYLNKNNIHWIPMVFGIEDERYRATMEPEQVQLFLDKMRQGGKSHTSQVTIDDYLAYWTPVLEQNKAIIHIALSSGLSGSFNAGMLARETLLEKFPDAQIYVVDSLSACSGLGILLNMALDLRKQNKLAGEAFAHLEQHKLEVNHWYSPDDLSYLKRGGRISPAQALIGSMLNIKPMMNVNTEGKLVAVGKVKGRKRVLEYMRDRIVEDIIDPEKQTVFISHADCLDDANKLYELIKPVVKAKDIQIVPLGPIIASHTGPGLIALFFRGKPRTE